jgi:hypothetical protein
MRKTAEVSVFSRTIAVLLLLAGYNAAFGQGQINFFTYNMDADYGIVFQSNGVTRASGSAFSAQLFGSTTEEGTFVAISPVTSFSTGFGAGYVNYGTITLPTAPGNEIGAIYYYELLVWTAAAGSYEVASMTLGDQLGISEVAALVLGEVGSDVYPEEAANGFHNLTLTPADPVPEPATLALMGLVGLSLLLFRRRR